MNRSRPAAFTLVELSLVLVVVALLIGGVVAGRDLVRASLARGQVTQLERYTTAITLFQDSYGYLPGDIPAAAAANAGLPARSSCAATAGDGVVRGFYGTCSLVGYAQSGEPTMFWRDLSAAGLIDQTFSVASGARIGARDLTTPPGIRDYFPRAASGNGGFLYVWSGGPQIRYDDGNNDGQNYLTVAAVTKSEAGTDTLYADPSLTASTAWAIDAKVDDGLPQAGRLQAFYTDAGMPGSSANGYVSGHWAAGGEADGRNCGGGCTPRNGPTTAATPRTADTCYDNGGAAGAAQSYSVGGDERLNCALSLRF